MSRTGKTDKLEDFLETARVARNAPVPKVGGTDFIYINGARDTMIVNSYMYELGIQTRHPFVDKAGSNDALRKLLAEVGEGDTLVIGSITDLANPAVSDMLLILEAMQARGVAIKAKMQPNYNLAEYQTAIRLMRELCDDLGFTLKHVG